MKKDDKITITTLCDNSVGHVGVLAEWGLSMLIETPSNTILFDTGHQTTCVHNAKVLGKDLSKVDTIVLSHGHMDHTGGLLPVLKSINTDLYTKKPRKIDIIAHPDIWQAKYDIADESCVWAGMLASRELLENNGASFTLSPSPFWLTDDMVMTGEIPMQTPYEHLDEDMVHKHENHFAQDQLADDQALVIKTSKGLIVVLGCAHRGLINTLLHAQKITNEQRIYMVLGGTHLLFASKEQIEKTIAALQELNVQKIGVSHCTGLPASAKLSLALGEKFFFNTAGTQLEIDTD